MKPIGRTPSATIHACRSASILSALTAGFDAVSASVSSAPAKNTKDPPRGRCLPAPVLRLRVCRLSPSHPSGPKGRAGRLAPSAAQAPFSTRRADTFASCLALQACRRRLLVFVTNANWPDPRAERHLEKARLQKRILSDSALNQLSGDRRSRADRVAGVLPRIARRDAAAHGTNRAPGSPRLLESGRGAGCAPLTGGHADSRRATRRHAAAATARPATDVEGRGAQGVVSVEPVARCRRVTLNRTRRPAIQPLESTVLSGSSVLPKTAPSRTAPAPRPRLGLSTG